MNNARREAIKKALELMEDALVLLERAHDGEQDAMSSLEETNLENTDRYSEMEDNVNALEEACNCLQEAIDCAESI